jgi:DNA modification methylase
MEKSNQIILGDCRETMRSLPEKSIQMCVTSPPYYGLRDYGVEGQLGLEQTPEEYIQAMVEVFREVHRVLKDDGTLWLNIGDSYYNYRPGKGQALVKQTVSNTKQDLPDTCARRGNKLEGLKEKDLIGIPWMLAFALRADGWYLRQDIIWHKPNPMPESVKDRCTKAHEYVFLLTKQPKYYYDADSIRTPLKEVTKKRVETSWSCDRANMSAEGAQGIHVEKMGARFAPEAGANKRSVWSIPTQSYKGAHFATFPVGLVEPCILAGSREEDIVLDPFIGSGTTAMVAKQHNRKYIGCELNESYQPLQEKRIANLK